MGKIKNLKMGKMDLNKNMKLQKSAPAQRNISVKKSREESFLSTAYETEMSSSVTPKSKSQTRIYRKIPNFYRTMENLSVSKSKSPRSCRSNKKIKTPYLINGELPNYLRTTHLVRIRSKDPNGFKESLRTHSSSKNV